MPRLRRRLVPVRRPRGPDRTTLRALCAESAAPLQRAWADPPLAGLTGAMLPHMAEADAAVTDRRIVRIDPSYLHLCHAVMTAAAAGEDARSQLHPDVLVGLVAEQQDGVILREQLALLGLGRGAIAHRRRRSLLVALHAGVYLWGRRTPTTMARARGAVAAAGRGAVISDGWALALWGLRDAVGPVDVTVSGRRVRAAGIRAHVRAPLHPADVRAVRGIPVTSPARALLDSAASLAPGELAALVERAQVQRRVTKAEIAAAIERAGARPGVAALRAIADDPVFTRSRAERRLVALLRAAGLPEPIFNAIVDRFEVDALWSRQGVVLEFDSYAFHATRAAFERDRRKSAALQRAGVLVLRTTWEELSGRSHALVARVAEALALSAAAARARAGS